jgi:hypothetical protein
MEINQVTVLIALLSIYASSGEYFHVFREVSLKTKRNIVADMPTSIFFREKVRMFVSGSMLCSTGCRRIEWERALNELTVNI